MKDYSAVAISLFTIFIAHSTLSSVVTAKEHNYLAAQEYPAFEPATSEDNKSFFVGLFPQETVVAEAACNVLMLRSEELDFEYDLFRAGKKIFSGTHEEVLAERERLGCR